MNKETLLEILNENNADLRLITTVYQLKYDDMEIDTIWKNYQKKLLQTAIELNQEAIKQLELFRKE